MILNGLEYTNIWWTTNTNVVGLGEEMLFFDSIRKLWFSDSVNVVLGRGDLAFGISDIIERKKDQIARLEVSDEGIREIFDNKWLPIELFWSWLLPLTLISHIIC